MKKSFCLIFFLLSFKCFGQNKETIYYSVKWTPTIEKKAKYIREITRLNDTLYVVKDLTSSGRTIMKGMYYSMQPEIENGLFRFYNCSDTNKVSWGYYSHGMMVGTWNIVDFCSSAAKIINYDFKVIKNERDSSIYFPDTMPNFKASKSLKSFSDYLANNIVYPPMATKFIIQGQVLIKFTIDETGQVRDIEVVKSVQKDLDREAMRALAQCPIWTPGYQHGKPVKVTFVIPINFNLTK
jgi:TonB family protein